MAEIILNGVTIDEDTGEIIGNVAPGFDRASWAASQLADANAQIKAWEQAKAIAQQAVMRYQGDRTATYGNFKVSIRAAKRQTQDVPAIREWIRDTELLTVDLYALAQAAKGFDTDALPAPLADMVRDHTNETTTKPYCVVETIRKDAPKLVPA